MAGRIDTRLAELGITLPVAMAPMANYVPFVVSGGLVVVSGQVPAQDGAIAVTGKVGETVSVEHGQAAARLCFMNVLTHLRTACGGRSRPGYAGGPVGRVCRVVGRVQPARSGDERSFGFGSRGVRRAWPARAQHDWRTGVAGGCGGRG